jgi:hypothetical protein
VWSSPVDGIEGCTPYFGGVACAWLGAAAAAAAAERALLGWIQ